MTSTVAELSEYERLRLENIRKNEQVLRSLHLATGSIPEVSSALYVTPPASHKKRPPKRKRVVEEVTPTPPARRSSRLAGIKAEMIAFPKDHELHSDLVEAPKVIQLDEKIGERELKKVLEGLVVKEEGDEGANGLYATHIDSLNENSSGHDAADVDGLRQRFQALRVAHEEYAPAVKLLKERIYSATFHPDASRVLLSVGDKAGYLAFWVISPGEDCWESLSLSCQSHDWEPTSYSYRAHAGSVFFQGYPLLDASKLVTCGYDNKIRHLDLGAGEFVDVYTHAAGRNDYLTYLTTNPTGTVMYFGTQGGNVGRLDIREPNYAVKIWEDMADSKIGGLELNPVNEHVLAAASNARYVRLFDTRKLMTPKRRDDEGSMLPPGGMLGEWHHGRSVNHCTWSPDGQRLLTVCHDDLLRIYHTYSQTKETFTGREIKIHHNNQTGKWVTMLRSKWIPRAQGHAAWMCASMEKKVDVFSGLTGERLCRLVDPGLTAVPAVVAAHPTQDWVLGGNASGKVTFWC